MFLAGVSTTVAKDSLSPPSAKLSSCVYSAKLISNKDFVSSPTPKLTSPSKLSLLTYQVGAFRVFQAITATFPLLAFALEG